MNSYKRQRLGGKETPLEISLEPGVWFTFEEMSVLNVLSWAVMHEIASLRIWKSSGSFSQKSVGSLWSFGGTEENPGLSTHHTQLQSLSQPEEWTPSCGHAGQGGSSQGPDTDHRRWPHMFVVKTTHPAGRAAEELLSLREGKEETRVSLQRKLGGSPWHPPHLKKQRLVLWMITPGHTV